MKYSALHIKDNGIRPIIPIAIVVVALVVLIIFAIISLTSITNEDINSSQTASSVQRDNQDNLEALEANNNPINSSIPNAKIPFDPTTDTSLSSIADASSPTIINLAYADGTCDIALSEENRSAINNALEPFLLDNYPVSFLFINCNTGYGIAYNIDTEIYGASTFKAPYVQYVCETFIETGERSLEDRIDFYVNTPDEDPVLVGTSSIYDVIYETIVDSDNDAFTSLRIAFDGEPFDNWLASRNISVDHTTNTLFPTYSARNGTKLWLSLYNYFNSASETSIWLKSLLEDTEVSFLRDALDESYEGIEIVDKAGWYAANDPNEGYLYDSTSDMGIITYEDNDYLLCIMTGFPYDDVLENNPVSLAETSFESLAGSIFAAHDQLNE